MKILVCTLLLAVLASPAWSIAIDEFCLYDHDPVPNQSAEQVRLYSNSATVAVHLSIADGNATIFYLGEDPQGSYKEYTYTGSEYLYTFSDPLQEGARQLYCKVKGDDGSWAQAGASIALDLYAPLVGAVTIADALNGYRNQNKALVCAEGFQDSIGDSPSGVWGYYFTVDGQASGFADHPCLMLYPLADGEHTIEIKAQDCAGNISDTARASLCIDTLPPYPGSHAEVVIDGGAYYSNSTNLLITWRGFLDAGYCREQPGIDNYMLSYFADGKEYPSHPRLNPGKTSKPYSYWQGAPQGTLEVRVQAVDRAGNTSVAVSDTIVVDYTSPRILAAGFWDTNITMNGKATFSVVAITDDKHLKRLYIAFIASDGEMTVLESTLNDYGQDGDATKSDMVLTLVDSIEAELLRSDSLFLLAGWDLCDNPVIYLPMLKVDP